MTITRFPLRLTLLVCGFLGFCYCFKIVTYCISTVITIIAMINIPLGSTRTNN